MSTSTKPKPKFHDPKKTNRKGATHQRNVVRLLQYEQIPEILYHIGLEYVELKLGHIAVEYIRKAFYQDKTYRTAINFVNFSTIYAFMSEDEDSKTQRELAMDYARKALRAKDTFNLSKSQRATALGIIAKYTSFNTDSDFIVQFLNESNPLAIPKTQLFRCCSMIVQNPIHSELVLNSCVKAGSLPGELTLAGHLAVPQSNLLINEARAKFTKSLVSVLKAKPGPFPLDQITAAFQHLHHPFTHHKESNASLFGLIAETFDQITLGPPPPPSIPVAVSVLDAPNPDLKIRVGVICEALAHDTPMCALLGDLIVELSNHPTIDLTYYTTARPDGKLYADRLFQLDPPRHTQIPSSIPEIVNAIRKDHLDIALFPNVTGSTKEFLIALKRVAKNQVALWTNSDTTGCPTMDYFLTPTRTEIETTEKQLQIDPVFFNNTHCDIDTIPLEQLKAAFPKVDPRVFDPTVTLASCVYSKQSFNTEYIDALKKILNRNQGIHLLMTELQHDDHQFEQLAHEIPYDTYHSRILFIPPMPTNYYLSLMKHRVTVALDPPSNGHNSTIEHLTQQILVVTLPGKKVNTRFTSFIIDRFIPDLRTKLVAADYNDYVDKVTDIVKSSSLLIPSINWNNPVAVQSLVDVFTEICPR